MTSTSTPVLVLHGSTHGSLGIIRSLGRLGIPVYCTYASDFRGPGTYSRYCRGCFLWDFDPAVPQASLAPLVKIAELIGRPPVLMPTWDETAVFTAEYESDLRSRFIYPQTCAELVRNLVNKQQMHRLAREHGIPVPNVVFPQRRADVAEFAKCATFPVMLKGIDGNQLKRATGKKMVIVRSAAELMEMYDELNVDSVANLMLQEYIPGGEDSTWMFNGYFDRSSECLLGITGRKLRKTPVYTGMTSLGVCEPNEAVDRLTRRWMKALGYRGILDIGYQYDERDGQYKVLDVNPRIGATFRLFVAVNGLDVARCLYSDITGNSVPESGIQEGRKWMVELDFKSSFDYWRDRKLSLLRWLRSLRGIHEFGYFAKDDVQPLLRLCWMAIARLLRRKQRRAEPESSAVLSPDQIPPHKGDILDSGLAPVAPAPPHNYGS